MSLLSHETKVINIFNLIFYFYLNFFANNLRYGKPVASNFGRKDWWDIQSITLSIYVKPKN